jgi:hypothetical protein
MPVKTANDIAALLMAKMEDVAQGKNIAGAETLCRLTEAFCKLVTTQMVYAANNNLPPSIPEIGQVTTPVKALKV